MQTILGANGAIGQELSKHLINYTDKIRQVSRNPKRVHDTDELLSADLLNFDQTQKAVQGSDVVYLVAGLKYETVTWQEQWPKVMKHTIDACKKHNSKLVFFDNVYPYGLVEGVMTEETPFNPTSKKGEVRAKIATQLLEEMKAGNLQAMIVRAADFYGPNVITSLTHSMVTDRVKKGKAPQWIGDQKKNHSFTYTPDAGKCVAMLGNTPSAYQQTWHALTSPERMSGEEYIRIACKLTDQTFKVQALPKWGVLMMGLFVPVLREFIEMMYQYENDYYFDSTKFQKAFNMSATSYQEGIAETLK
jgi:nucleoside-diphosphate-sugar epimerase